MTCDKVTVVSKNLKVNALLREEFSKPFGMVLKTKDILKKVGRRNTIYAIGDVTVATLLSLGYMPKVSVFDYKTGRVSHIIPIIKRTYSNPVCVRNRRGVLGARLWRAVGKASRKRSTIGIRVVGEEDLASLACIYFARNGDIVMYGLRGIGIVTIKVDKKIKNYVEQALKIMQRARNNY